jgi:hypothetical protein
MSAIALFLLIHRSSSGYGRNVSVFDAKVEDAVELLHEALWMYLEAASDCSSKHCCFVTGIRAYLNSR